MREVLQAQDANAFSARPAKAEDPLREWRAKWRQIMRDAVVYFDNVPEAQVEHMRPYIAELGSRVQPFYDQAVTHVVSENHRSDVCVRARNSHLKVYTLEKLTRFVSALLDQSVLPLSQNLARLLESDARMQSPRTDFYYFHTPYILVFDPTGHHRHLCVKEWKPAGSVDDGDWPQLRKPLTGMSPFTSRAVIRSEKRRHRQVVPEVGKEDGGNAGNANFDTGDNNANANATANANREAQSDSRRKLRRFENKENVPYRAPLAAATPSVRLREFGEIVASGVSRYSQTSKSFSAKESVPSRELQHLRRKVMPDVPESLVPRKPAKKPGWCENCLEKYEDLAEHVSGKSHRSFAANDDRFAVVDDIIEQLRRK